MSVCIVDTVTIIHKVGLEDVEVMSSGLVGGLVGYNDGTMPAIYHDGSAIITGGTNTVGN